MISFNRRQFLSLGAASLAWGAIPRRGVAADPRPTVDLVDRIRGLVYGTVIGDALGGPIEFQARDRVQTLKDPPKVWRNGEMLDADGRAAATARLQLRSYRDLRPGTESYGQWNPNSLPGTITDDSRHKLVLLHGLHEVDRERRWPFTVKDLAQAYLTWPNSAAVVGRAGYRELAKDWLEEWQFSARWVLGERDLLQALPPERMWQGLATCCGQMTLPPLAVLYAGQPTAAYRAAYALGFFDNGIGKDLNAALVAGLAQALTVSHEPGAPAAPYLAVVKTMRETDPLRFQKIRWSERAVNRWLNLAGSMVKSAEGQPARLFASLDQEFAQTTKWEAQVPFVVAFACLELAAYDPLAALQLSMEWGHDTDSLCSAGGSHCRCHSWSSALPGRLARRGNRASESGSWHRLGRRVPILGPASSRRPGSHPRGWRVNRQCGWGV
jgi:ADP-ribosylglycohydrolase